MLDVLFLAATVFLFWLSVVYVRRCDRLWHLALGGPRRPGPPAFRPGARRHARDLRKVPPPGVAATDPEGTDRGVRAERLGDRRVRDRDGGL